MNDTSRRFILGFIIVLGIYILYLGKFFILPAITAALLAFLCYPIYNWLRKKTNMKSISAVLVIIGLFIVILVPLSFLMRQLIFEAISFYAVLRTISPTTVATSLEGLLNAIGITVEPEFLTSQINQILSGVTASVFRTIQFVSAGVASALLQVIFTFIFMYFFLLHGKKIYRYLDLFLPFSDAGKKQLQTTLQGDIRALFLGQGLIAIIQGIAGGLGFWIFGVPNPVFWGVIMAFLSVIPPFGTALVWFPVTLFLVFQETYWLAIGFFLWSLFITSNIDNILRPYIVGQMTKISFLTVLLGVLIGIRAFGLIGVVLGPLLISIFLVLSKIYYAEYIEKK